jgi:phosphohistidine phosphatase
MEKSLILVRHAESRNQEQGQKDLDRVLSDTGVRDASRLGRFLYLEGRIPQLIYSSHAVRAIQTSKLIGEQLKLDDSEINIDEELYEASVRSLLNLINNIEEGINSIIIIGHNPAITHLCEHLSEDVIGYLPPGSMIHLTFKKMKWKEIAKGTGHLKEIKLPDQITF